MDPHPYPFPASNAIYRNDYVLLETLLVETGLDPNGFDFNDDDKSYLMLATFADSQECIQVLLKYGARINYVRATGQTALSFAVLNNNLECIKLLLEQKADPALSMIHPAWTSLHHAVFYDEIETAKLLIKYHISLEITNGNSATALEMAVKHYKDDMVSILLDAGAKVYPSFSHFAIIKCRQNVKRAIIIVKGILKMRWHIYRDVVTLVGEFMWKTRDSEEWHI